MMMAALGEAAALLFGGLETGTVLCPGAFEENPLSRGGTGAVAVALFPEDEDGSPGRREDGTSIRRNTASAMIRTTRNVRGRESVRLIDQRPAVAASVFSR
jgi:hypothetical protein